MTAGPRVVGEATVGVLYRHFYLGMASRPGADHVIDANADLVDVGPAGLVLMSAASDHRARVRVEYWRSRPDASTVPPGAATKEGQVEIDAEPLVLAGVTTGELHELPAPPAAGLFGVRVICEGRAELEAIEPIDPLADVTGVERWTIQLWPEP